MKKRTDLPNTGGRFLNPLKRARVNAGLSQIDLGRLAGCSGNIISKLELGLRPPRINARNQPKDLALARRIAVILGTDLGSIFPDLADPAAAPAQADKEGDDENAGT